MLCWFSALLSRAQTGPIVEVDRGLGVTKTGLPYDQEFLLKFVYDTRPRISYIEIREGKMDFITVPSINNVTKKAVNEQRRAFIDSATLATIVKFKIIEAEKEFELFIPMPRLRPDKDYKIVVHNSLSDEEISDYVKKGFGAYLAKNHVFNFW